MCDVGYDLRWRAAFCWLSADGHLCSKTTCPSATNWRAVTDFELRLSGNIQLCSITSRINVSTRQLTYPWAISTRKLCWWRWGGDYVTSARWGSINRFWLGAFSIFDVTTAYLIPPKTLVSRGNLHLSYLSVLALINYLWFSVRGIHILCMVTLIRVFW